MLRLVNSSSELDLLRGDNQQLAWAGSVTADGSLSALSQRRKLSIGLENANLLWLNIKQYNTGIVVVTRVLAVLLVIEPSLERARPVLLNLGWVFVEDSFTRNRDPVGGLGIKVSNVDLRISFNVVGLARIGVHVEREDETLGGSRSHGTRSELSIGTTRGEHTGTDVLGDLEQSFDLLLRGKIVALGVGALSGGVVSLSVGRHFVVMNERI